MHRCPPRRQRILHTVRCHQIQRADTAIDLPSVTPSSSPAYFQGKTKRCSGSLGECFILGGKPMKSRAAGPCDSVPDAISHATPPQSTLDFAISPTGQSHKQLTMTSPLAPGSNVAIYIRNKWGQQSNCILPRLISTQATRE